MHAGVGPRDPLTKARSIPCCVTDAAERFAAVREETTDSSKGSRLFFLRVLVTARTLPQQTKKRTREDNSWRSTGLTALSMLLLVVNSIAQARATPTCTPTTRKPAD